MVFSGIQGAESRYDLEMHINASTGYNYFSQQANRASNMRRII